MCKSLIFIREDDDGDWEICLSPCAIIHWFDGKSGIIYMENVPTIECSLEFCETSQLIIDNDPNLATDQWKLMSILDNLPRGTFIPVLGS